MASMSTSLSSSSWRAAGRGGAAATALMGVAAARSSYWICNEHFSIQFNETLMSNLDSVYKNVH